MIRLADILKESKTVELANKRIDELPKGKVFSDAKNIEGVFDRSRHSWSEVIEAAEQNKANAESQYIDLKNIHITQPNIQSEKVKKMVQDISDRKPIDVVEFPDGEKAIHDGHHRLTANWALGNKKVLVNLIKAK